MIASPPKIQYNCDDAPPTPLLPYYHLPTQQPSATAVPYAVINPILGRGSSMAVPTTVNIPNGCDLFLNASSKLGDITTNTPLPPITMNSNDNNHQCILIQHLSRRDIVIIMDWDGGLIMQQYFFSTTQWFFDSVCGVSYEVIYHLIAYTITKYTQHNNQMG